MKDNAYSVLKFRETFDVRFPLFPDENLIIHKQLGGPDVPFFVCVKITDYKKVEVFNTHLGKIADIVAFTNMLADELGL